MCKLKCTMYIFYYFMLSIIICCISCHLPILTFFPRLVLPIVLNQNVNNFKGQF